MSLIVTGTQLIVLPSSLINLVSSNYPILPLWGSGGRVRSRAIVYECRKSQVSNRALYRVFVNRAGSQALYLVRCSHIFNIDHSMARRALLYGDEDPRARTLSVTFTRTRTHHVGLDRQEDISWQSCQPDRTIELLYHEFWKSDHKKMYWFIYVPLCHITLWTEMSRSTKSKI